jgi:hypothetical protein
MHNGGGEAWSLESSITKWVWVYVWMARRIQPRKEEADRQLCRAGCLAIKWDGLAGREAQAGRESQCIYLAVQMHAQSFKASTDCLVEVPSFRPSHAPWTTPAGSSILLNLVRRNPALSPTAAL